MDKKFVLATAGALALSLALVFPSAAQEKEKKKAEKARGDVGLLDLEKNYMILVTKEGKLITLDFGEKSKVTMLEAKDATIADIDLGSSAEVEYQTKDEKAMITKMEFRPAKRGE
jgi:hypothetical protein